MKKYRTTPKFKQTLIWLATVILSLVLIFVFNKYFSKDLDILNMSEYTVKATVVSLDNTITDDGGYDYQSYIQYFTAKIISGDYKGEEVTAYQETDNYSGYSEKVVEAGDKIILYNLSDYGSDAEWTFGSYARLDTMLAVGIIFLVLLVVFGLTKGVNTIISLAFTCLSIFLVFIPSILSGHNIYLMTCVICVYTIVMTLILTNGASIKSLVTILGCSFGVGVAALLSVILDKVMKLSGITDEHSVYIQYLGTGEINLKGLIFAMIVIGAMGAVMDVAMDISSSLYEVKLHAPDLSYIDLIKSGIRIGRDIMGTMANTLVLAYIGSNLCAVLLYISYSTSLLELLNRETIIVEMMQSLVGSLAILLTIPLTSIVASVLYTNKYSLERK